MVPIYIVKSRKFTQKNRVNFLYKILDLFSDFYQNRKSALKTQIFYWPIFTVFSRKYSGKRKKKKIPNHFGHFSDFFQRKSTKN